MEHSCGDASCECASSPTLYGQSLSEMDFERGVWSAAMDGELQKVRSFLDKGGDPNTTDSSGYTALVSPHIPMIVTRLNIISQLRASLTFFFPRDRV